MRLTSHQQSLLHAMITGHSLKSHRYLDGTKEFRLHALTGEETPVQRSLVNWLIENSLVTSNQKFPAATFTLTDKGRALAETLADNEVQPGNMTTRSNRA